MSLKDYNRASRAGRKEYENRIMSGRKPTLEVLDDILPDESLSYEFLGLVQIPIDQIVGTKYGGRSSAFASNFMPLLQSNTEFATKWSMLSSAHEEKGIREPIKAWEYMNKFYVEEGNKRVSVMKYFEALSIPGEVTRILPKRTEDKEVKIYYEFLDFYKVSKVNYIWFSEEGSFTELQKEIGREPGVEWSDDEKLVFSSIHSRFLAACEARGGKTTGARFGDAFLAFIKLYGYQYVEELSANEIDELVDKAWEEFELLQYDGEDKIDLKMAPTEEKTGLLSKLNPFGTAKGVSELKIAFLYAKTAQSYGWTYGHELGRMHLEETFPDEVTTIHYDNVTEKNVSECIEQAVREGCNIIFTTSPAFAQASLKAAIKYPEVNILNCSLNTTHRYIRTYYARMYEAKFIMGALAGAMAENDRVIYIADYPIKGVIAQINAFAYGVKMVNPRAKIYLEWTSRKNVDVQERIEEVNPTCISGEDIITPDEGYHYYGIYHRDSSGERLRNLAMPLCHWGKFYERLVRTIMEGTWKYDDDPTATKAINYWWGMSADVVEVICSKRLPVEMTRLVDILKHMIISEDFQVFSGPLHAQNGVVKGGKNDTLTPEEVIEMDWLAENIVGSIPDIEELEEQALPVFEQQGVQIGKGDK